MSKNPPALVFSVAPITMSSREIADLTKKRHPDVKRDIEKMLAELQEDVSSFAHIYQDSMNRDQTEYRLERELTETLLTGYSAILRRKVVVRLRELEQAAAKVVRPAIPFAVQPSDALTESEQTVLRDMLRDSVHSLPHRQQAGAMIKGWSKLKAHFKVGYRDIPRSEFPEAISILARHIADFDPMIEDKPQALAAPAAGNQLDLALGGIASLTSSVASLASAVEHLSANQRRPGPAKAGR